ncbi:hypothetical protein VNO78_34449 [Psophocarpus tetragonolobus]|uniref:CCHC-type domain-containing protein n=1 Tax=Psophocarpus tetragonolobus TaxID=3891 RepID=A0AAN9NVT1_PSOTE
MRRGSSNFNNTNWRDKSKKEGSSLPREQGSKSSSGKHVPNPCISSTSKINTIKCFKCLTKGHIALNCPNKKRKIFGDNEIATTEVKGRVEIQKGSLFQTRCSIEGKICSIIIYGGNCTNLVSSRLVTKLNLETTPHPQPYKLQSLGENGDISVNKQVEVKFSIGKYEDVVLCDVVPMDACHLLLGKSWQVERNVNYNEKTNKISFMHQGCKLRIALLSPKEAIEDLIRLKTKIGQERKEEKEKEIKEKELQEKGEMSEPYKKSGNKKSETHKGNKSETLERKKSCLAKKSEAKRVMLAKKPLYVLYCKNNVYANSKKLGPVGVEFLLQEYKDVFPKEVPNVLPPLRGIEHHIDLIPGASLPNRPAYRSNPQETQEIQRQVDELISKKWVQESNAKQANKGRRRIVFEPGDWVWVHMRKERFPKQRKSKLQPRADGPFQVLERIHDNAYKIGLPGDYNTSAIFNVSDLSPFNAEEEALDLRTNPLQEGGNDEDTATNKDSKVVERLGTPMTRARARKAREVLQQVVATILEAAPNEKDIEAKLIQCMVIIEDS